MNLSQTFVPLKADDILEKAQACKNEGCRFVQILAVNTEQGIDLIYTYMKPYDDESKVAEVINYKVEGVSKDATIASITDFYLAAFVFENEIHDLFGVNISGIAIDFKGNFYALSQNEPMTIISPEQLAAREKAKKIAAAKAAKAAKEAKEAQAAAVANSDASTETTQKGGE